jgi:hypothetical protein
MELRDEMMITILHVNAVMIMGMGATKTIMEAQIKVEIDMFATQNE